MLRKLTVLCVSVERPGGGFVLAAALLLVLACTGAPGGGADSGPVPADGAPDGPAELADRGSDDGSAAAQTRSSGEEREGAEPLRGREEGGEGASDPAASRPPADSSSLASGGTPGGAERPSSRRGRRSARAAGARERSWSDVTLARLGLREKIGQMLMPMILGDFTPEGTESHDRIARQIEELGVGGVIVSVGAPADVALKLNDLQGHSQIPLLVASDLENGPGFRFAGAVHLPGVVELGGATRFPPLMAIGATGSASYAYRVGEVTAREARALGIHVPFAPVLDVNNNARNPVINVRSFGEDPEMVARMGISFIQGVQDHGALATGKHFPGHGDTETDSHVRLPVIPVSTERLESVELHPFRRAVAAGMEAVMTAHVAVPEITGSPDMPATLSGPVVTDLLRRDMSFDGLIFTDAMDMQAVTRRFPRGEASVRAVEAGADVVLMPPSVEEARDALLDAVRSGRIDESRIDASVRRILGAKEGLGLHRGARVPLEAIPRRVGVPEHTELARRIAERSITLVRNRRNLLPLLGTRSADVVSVTYRGPHDLLAGKYLDTRLREEYPGLRTVRLDRNTRDEAYEELEREVRGVDLVVVSLHVSAVARDDDPALPEELTDFIRLLERRRTPHIAVSFGNPYLIGEFPDVQAYMLAWGGGRASQEAVGEALFGRIPTAGRLPIAIPPHFRLGAGIHLRGDERRAGGR